MEKTVSYQNTTLFYRLAGSGPFVVLLHGFGEVSGIWENQVPFLEKRFTVLVPDLPGSGQSDMIADMSMEGLAESVHFILSEEGIKKCTLIGHSMGGYVTLAFAEKYPQLLNGFGLFHSTAYGDSEEKIANRKRGIRFLQQYGAFEFLKTSLPNLYSETSKQTQPLLLQQHLAKVGNFTKEALIAYYKAMIERPDRTRVLKQNNCPVLFVLGKLDTAVPLKDGLEQAHLPALAYIHILNQSGHMGMCEEPVESNTLLLEYLSGGEKE